METLKGKYVLLVGATGTIGRETLQLLATSGAHIFVAARNEEKLSGLCGKYNIDPGQCFKYDITNPSDTEELKTKYFNTFPRLDILINATGIGIIKPLEALTTADFLRSVHVNLYGPFLLMQQFLPAMKLEKKGLVINIPGVLGKTPMAGAAAYSASKYGLNGMMQSLREELKRTEVRITNLFLGGTDSEFWDTIDLRVQRDKMIQAKEAARAIWFLCQQPSSAVISEMVLQPFNHQVI